AMQEAANTSEPVDSFWREFSNLSTRMQPFLDAYVPGTSEVPGTSSHTETANELHDLQSEVEQDISSYRNVIGKVPGTLEVPGTSAALHQAAEAIAPIAEQSRDLIKQLDLLYKLVLRLSDICEKDLTAKANELWPTRDIAKARKTLDEARKEAVDQLKHVRYFYRQAHWLLERFPDAELRDVEGLVKLVSIEEIERNDWSLTPGRYVGVAPEDVDEDFDFEEALRDIHVELADLNTEAQQLAATIAKNFEELGI
ncbi:MAG: SAM-dependent DNA methyltransferase, partial [bacterium]|nr:SAM-dependent DNA methyltransferase [bacterium]